MTVLIGGVVVWFAILDGLLLASFGEIWQLKALDEQGKIVGTMDFGLEDDQHRPT